MVRMVNISEAILEEADLESGLLEVFACVAYAIFCRDSADVDVCGVKQFEDLSQSLLCCVDSFESRILLDCLVASLVEREFFRCIWAKVVVDLASACARHAMSRPYAALLLE